MKLNLTLILLLTLLICAACIAKAETPTITDLSANPPAFNPDTNVGSSSGEPGPTTISYTLSGVNNAVARLEIYDSDGNLVKTIDGIQQNNGPNSIQWDGTGNSGIVPDGIYTAKIIVIYDVEQGQIDATTTVIVDTTPPTSTLAFSGTPGENGWYVSPVTVTMSSTDDLSGVAYKFLRYNLPPYQNFEYTEPYVLHGDKTYNVYCFSIDKAWNYECAYWGGHGMIFQWTHFDVVKIDEHAPTITLSAPSDGYESVYKLGQSVMASYDIQDPVNPDSSPFDFPSGVNLGSLQASALNGQPIDTSAAGEHTFTVSVKDNAGNLATKTVKYYVAYNFIEPPQLVPKPTLKITPPVYNQGAGIPVAFTPVDYNGNPVTNANALLYVAPITNGIVGTEVKATPNGKSNTGNTFRYDPLENQYIYNLNTQMLQPGTYQLRVALDDGTSLTTTIKMVK